MDAPATDALVVGHLCLDIIPTFLGGAGSPAELFIPGKLIDVSDAVLATGGASSNTGLALHRLGFKVSIVGKVGDDHFGGIIVDILRRIGPHLVKDMVVAPGAGSSYTIVVNPPGFDRIFLHSPGANHTFAADEIPDSAFAGARLVHFGYPPLMRKFFRNDGQELIRLFTRARELGGLTASLDMSRPDPDGESGAVDWTRYLENVLPHVDVFLPSIDEIVFMTDRPLFDRLVREAGDGNPAARLHIDQIRALADRLLALGPAVIGFKLGDAGFYLKASSDLSRLAGMGRAAPPRPEEWVGREFIAGCKKVDVAGTTGAGDCTIAGFLGAFLKGFDPDRAVTMAVSTGGASVEARDSNSGVPAWEALEKRLAAGWPNRTCPLVPSGWEETSSGNFRPA